MSCFNPRDEERHELPFSADGLRLWLDASDLDGDGVHDDVDNDDNNDQTPGGVALAWVSKVGGGGGGNIAATLTNGSLPVSLNATGVNGKPAIEFSGSSRLATPPLTLGEDFAAFVVVRADVVDATQMGIEHGLDTKYDPGFFITASSTTFPSFAIRRGNRIHGHSNAHKQVASGVPKLAALFSTGSGSFQFRSNGDAGTAVSSLKAGTFFGSSPITAPLNIGARAGTGPLSTCCFDLHGAIAEILLFDGVLPDVTVSRIESYLKQKYTL
jgi:hypothetical protein